MKMSRVFLFAGIGAALMYLFDPTNGEMRRARLRDQAMTMRSTLEDEFEGRSTYLADTARNIAAEARTMAEKLESNAPELEPKSRSTTRRASSES
jgi:hypothetical protein